MKKIIFLLIALFFFASSTSNAKIVYIDINYILNKSEIGKSLTSHLKKINDQYGLKYDNIEAKLVEKEKSLLAQQNILDKSEFDKKLTNLSNEINSYRSDKKKSQNNLKKIKTENTKKILEILNPIIKNFVEANSISLVIPKKNIVVGKKNLDITNEIIKLLNNKDTTLNFK